MAVKNIERGIILEGKYRESAEMGKVNFLRATPRPNGHIYRSRMVVLGQHCYRYAIVLQWIVLILLTLEIWTCRFAGACSRPILTFRD
jgi:hypothetical protein